MTRAEIINTLIKKMGYKDYLEIGLYIPTNNFTQIECLNKNSCDPYIFNDKDPYAVGEVWDENGNLSRTVTDNLTWRMTSDEMFAMVPYDKKWDIVFIDGLHLKEQLTKDILNSMKHLNKGGVIIIHDCLPDSEEMQTREYDIGAFWTGDVWKSLARMGQLGLKFNTLDTDFGVGIIPYQELSNVLREKCIDNEEFTWEDFAERRDEIMHVIYEDEVADYLDHFPTSVK